MDDKGDEKSKNLALKYGFTYLSRPNKGEFKKSGNLQYGYDHSEGEFVLVLDADFAPHPDALMETIPYMKDKTIGILQTPQFFQTDSEVHKRSAMEYGAGNVVELFYRITMPSRNVVGGTMCVGTSAIYRRKAIMEAGGTPKTEGSEDVSQGLMVNAHGYKTSYIPLIVSKGICPDNAQSYFRQQNRWCAGSIETYFSDTFNDAKLPFLAQLFFLQSPLYYITEALGPIINFHLLLLLIFHADKLDINNIVFFLPYLVFYYVLEPLSKLNRSRAGTTLSALTAIFTFIYTIPRVIFKKPLPWVATTTKVSNITDEFFAVTRISLVFLFLNLGLLVFAIYRDPGLLINVNALPVLFWVILKIVQNAYFSVQATLFVIRKKKEETLKNFSYFLSAFRWRVQLAAIPLLVFISFS